MSLHFDIITLFPEIFSHLHQGVIDKAALNQLINIQCWDPILYREKKHPHIDDRPYGGGPGQVMTCAPLDKCIEAIPKRGAHRKIIYLAPDGVTLTHQKSLELSKLDQIILICGRYEGIDDRIRQLKVDETLSIGDYVLSGGELPAAVLLDTVSRHIEGVLGNKQSSQEDSFSKGFLEHPNYTRPVKYKGLSIPDVLTSEITTMLKHGKDSISWARLG